MPISNYRSQRVHPEPVWRSLAQPRGRISPREGSKLLPDIPLTRVGLTDTLKLRLDGRALDRDLERLQKTGEFTRKESGVRKATSTGGTVKELGRQAFLFRKRDGLRLFAYEHCTFVEFSAPRVLDLYSDEQHLMSERDLRRAVDIATVDLLPWSTVRAQLHAQGEPWSTQRQDLAVNFDGSIDEIIEALRKQVHVLVRGTRSTVFDGAGIGWFPPVQVPAVQPRRVH